MSWFGKPTTKPTPSSMTSAVSELQRLRGRQVASLVRAGGQAINHQQSIFDVVVRLVDSRTLTLRITLPDDFPMQGPVIQTTSRVQHSWLDSQCRVVGHIDLTSWSAHADIGRIVSDIVTEFQRSPPVPIGRAATTPTPMYPDNSARPSSIPSYMQPFPPQALTYPQPPSMSTYPAAQAGYNGSAYQQPPSVQMPPVQPPLVQPPKRETVSHTQAPAIPAVFPELDQLSVNQLEKLVTDRATLKAYIKNMDSVVNFMKLYDDLVEGNQELADSNLAHESSISSLQVEIEELKHQLHTAQEGLNVKLAKQNELMTQFQPEPLVARVVDAADEADEASEEIASRFANGEIDVSQFVAEFQPIRKLFHLRTAKVDRYTHQ
ncbi:unnamed protein product [Aphanomyces euteiches]